MQLTDNAYTVATDKWAQNEESIHEMVLRVADHVGDISASHHGEITDRHTFFNLLNEKLFFPNSPTWTGAGTKLGQLAACFVLPIADDVGREPDGIFNTLRNAALIQQTGGGNGFDFSSIRPAGSNISRSKGKATGPIGFLRAYDAAFDVISQGGVRRGANMAVLSCDHPDVHAFIDCKEREGEISNFNISVSITDEFMCRYKNGDPDAAAIVDKIAAGMHRNGEPGVLFIDTANTDNPVPDLYKLVATNPCGEQWLGPYENCCLGSVNLAAHIRDGEMYWHGLADTVETATRFLDNVIDANRYVDGVPQLRERALLTRRIGLGVMGLADALFAMEIGYDTPTARDAASQIMEFVRYHAMRQSIELAHTRGKFPAYAESVYGSGQWIPPTPLQAHELSIGRPALHWGLIEEGIARVGIRNACQTTIAPTGTLSTVAGLEGYGCEPAFALGYTRHFLDRDGVSQPMRMISPSFSAALAKHAEEQDWEPIFREVGETGSCQNVPDLPYALQRAFVVAGDISVRDHIAMQAALQRWVDNGISKTINAPNDITERELVDAILLAHESGCKGLTVYRQGSREQVVLESDVSIRWTPVLETQSCALGGCE